MGAEIDGWSYGCLECMDERTFFEKNPDDTDAVFTSLVATLEEP